MARMGAVLLFAATLCAVVSPVAAEDLTGADTFICSPSEIRLCTFDEDCAIVAPWVLNIPSFILFDLEKKTLSTTEASGQNRSTSVKNLERGDGLIILQGAEGGRAFSFMIAEDTGLMTASVASELGGTIGFGACTPLPVR